MAAHVIEITNVCRHPERRRGISSRHAPAVSAPVFQAEILPRFVRQDDEN
jgi:hypothetical protein